MTRLQKIILFVGLGLGFGPSVYYVSLDQPTANNGRVCVDGVQSQGAEVHWFAAVSDTWTPDPALGEIGGSGTTCYDYGLSTTAIGGWRLAAMHGDPYHRARWQEAASGAGPASIKMWRSYKDIKADCLGLTSAANCLTLLREVSDCWVEADGLHYCVQGIRYGPGLGGVTAAGVPVTCTPDATMRPHPCQMAYGRTVEAIE